jgi:hypothetical protein
VLNNLNRDMGLPDAPLRNVPCFIIMQGAFNFLAAAVLQA